MTLRSKWRLLIVIFLMLRAQVCYAQEINHGLYGIETFLTIAAVILLGCFITLNIANRITTKYWLRAIGIVVGIFLILGGFQLVFVNKLISIALVLAGVITIHPAFGKDSGV